MLYRVVTRPLDSASVASLCSENTIREEGTELDDEEAILEGSVHVMYSMFTGALNAGGTVCSALSRI